jgi:hypothetical protein
VFSFGRELVNPYPYKMTFVAPPIGPAIGYILSITKGSIIVSD